MTPVASSVKLDLGTTRTFKRLTGGGRHRPAAQAGAPSWTRASALAPLPALLIVVAAKAATPQHPDLLSAYPVRPAWRVAGVDYAVGPATPPQKDPQSITMPDVIVDTANRRVTVNASVTLDGYDFSLHGGYTLTVQSNNVTVTNCLFVMGTNPSYYEVSGYGDNLVLRFNTFDGTATETNQSALIAVYGRNPAIEFNWMKNFGQHALEMNQAHGVTTGLLYRRNLIENGGTIAGSHVNYLQWGDGNAIGPLVTYNTTYQTRQAATGEGFQFDGFPGSSIVNARFANNTMITAGASVALSYVVHALGDNVNADSPDNSSGVIVDNYFDTSAAYGAFYPVDSAKPWVFSSNYALQGGAPEPVSGSAESHAPARPCIAAAMQQSGSIAVAGVAEAGSTLAVFDSRFDRLGATVVPSSGSWSLNAAATAASTGPFVAVAADKTGFSLPSQPASPAAQASCP